MVLTNITLKLSLPRKIRNRKYQYKREIVIGQAEGLGTPPLNSDWVCHDEKLRTGNMPHKASFKIKHRTASRMHWSSFSNSSFARKKVNAENANPPLEIQTLQPNSIRNQPGLVALSLKISWIWGCREWAIRQKIEVFSFKVDVRKTSPAWHTIVIVAITDSCEEISFLTSCTHHRRMRCSDRLIWREVYESANLHHS